MFIQAKNLHCGFDFCPAFWDWLVQGKQGGRVSSVEKVADDDLARWVEERRDAFFLRPDGTVAAVLAGVSDWAAGSGYDPAAQSLHFSRSPTTGSSLTRWATAVPLGRTRTLQTPRERLRFRTRVSRWK